MVVKRAVACILRVAFFYDMMALVEYIVFLNFFT